MVVMTLKLTEDNQRKLSYLVRQTGKTADHLANEAIERLAAETAPDSEDWKSDIMQAAGMWAGRMDLPDFAAIRRTMDRDVWRP